MDLTATSFEIEAPSSYSRSTNKYIYGTGLAFEIPKGFVGLIFPRSSIHKTDLDLSNCVGVIDSDYRGEVKFVFRCRPGTQELYGVGERVGQLVIMKLPGVEIEEVDQLSETVRGVGGFGSTGK